MTDEQIDLVRWLASEECRCGKTKVARQTFCRWCYAILPREMQRALYARIGQGYEQAFAAAVDFLDEREREQERKRKALR